MRKISIKPQERKLSFASIFLGKQENQLLELEHSASWLESGSFRKKMYGLRRFAWGAYFKWSFVFLKNFWVGEKF